jgi:hypothetical protein
MSRSQHGTAAGSSTVPGSLACWRPAVHALPTSGPMLAHAVRHPRAPARSAGRQASARGADDERGSQVDLLAGPAGSVELGEEQRGRDAAGLLERLVNGGGSVMTLITTFFQCTAGIQNGCDRQALASSDAGMPCWSVWRRPGQSSGPARRRGSVRPGWVADHPDWHGR